MAVTYGFYDSLNHDRLYNAQQMSAIFDGIINDGVFMSVGNQFHTVAGTGMQVIVKSGRAWFDSTWTLNDAEYPLSIDAADVLLTRIDAVVLEVNSEVATRANTIKVVKGTPASTPAKPTLTNTAAVHQHALAYVTVAKNITAITNSMIEIVVGKTETPYVTAILQTTDITDLFKKWESDFQVWFETVKGTLDGDVALNLQNQIDHCVKKADKATSADIEAGTADKWLDASVYKENKFGLGQIFSSIKDETSNKYVMCTGNLIPEKSDICSLYTPLNSKLYFNAYKAEAFIPQTILNSISYPKTPTKKFFHVEDNYIYIIAICNIATNSNNFCPRFIVHRYDRMNNVLITHGDITSNLDTYIYGSPSYYYFNDIITVCWAYNSYNSNEYYNIVTYNITKNKLISHKHTSFALIDDRIYEVIKYDNKDLVVWYERSGSYLRLWLSICDWNTTSYITSSTTTVFNIDYRVGMLFEKMSTTKLYMCYYLNSDDSMSFGTLSGFDIDTNTINDALTISTNTINQNMDAEYWYFPQHYLTYNNKKYIATCRGLITIDSTNGYGSIGNVLSETIASNQKIDPPNKIIEYNGTNIAISYSSIYILPTKYLSGVPYNLKKTNVTMLSTTLANYIAVQPETITKNNDSNYINCGNLIIGMDTPSVNKYSYIVINN